MHTDTSPDLRRPTRRASMSAERFRTPEQTDRPGMRWWWQSPVPASELVRELRAIADAGFGEVEIAFSKGFWADEQQREALTAVLTEAAALDVGVAMTLGAEWPVRTPNTTTGTQHAAQEMQYGMTPLPHGTTTRTLALPRPIDEALADRPTRLLAVTAASHPFSAPSTHRTVCIFATRTMENHSNICSSRRTTHTVRSDPAAIRVNAPPPHPHRNEAADPHRPIRPT